jgi:hypothetical protein
VRMSKGKKITRVSTGFCAYFDVDPSMIRVAAIELALWVGVEFSSTSWRGSSCRSKTGGYSSRSVFANSQLVQPHRQGEVSSL